MKEFYTRARRSLRRAVSGSFCTRRQPVRPGEVWPSKALRAPAQRTRKWRLDRDKRITNSYNTAKPAESATRYYLRTAQSHRSEVIVVQLSILVLNLVYAALGVVLMYLSYRLIDRLTPEVDFPAELKRGNIAVAIFIAALFISIALIVGRAIG
jgi:hypothetical protein